MKLDEIKKHPYFPFRNFRENDLSFLLLELYWVEVFREALSHKRSGQENLQNWSAAFPADRTDGNPMLHMVNRALTPTRALRVIQRENENNLVEFDIQRMTPLQFSGDVFVPFAPGITCGALDIDGDTPIEELVISSDVSPISEQYCISLIRKWCLEVMEVSKVKPLIEAYWCAVQSNLIEVDQG